MPKFQKGHAKVGGRKPGTLNRRTIWVREEMQKAGFDVFVEMKKACAKRDYGAIDSLSKLLPFLTPPLLPKEHLDDDSPVVTQSTDDTDKLSDDELIAAAKA